MPLTLRRFMERQIRQPRRRDPYRGDSKNPDGVQCSTCKSISSNGRWVQRSEAAVKRSTLCPACRQAKERYAEGVVEIHGLSWREKIAEILATLRNTETIARARNDQERILWVRNIRGVLKVYVTLPELARQMGRTLSRSFKGKVSYQPSSDQPFMRVIWQSPEKRR